MKKIVGKTLFQVAGLLFFVGFILAGSDGSLFPWTNFLGIPVSGAGVVLLFLTDRKSRPAPRRD